MPQQAFRRRSLKIGIISTVLFCSLCVGLILAACGQRAGTGAAPTAAVGAAAAEPIATPRVCSAVGCGYSLQVKFEVSVPQTYDVEVSVPGDQTLRMHCEGNSTEVIHSGLPEVVPTCLWNEGLEFYNFTPNELTLTLLAGNHRISQTFQPNYDSYYVNGPKCGPECRAAKVSFTTSLDTSPGALAQTAAARPIMLEVNRALLQATIIDATSMAVRSNSAVAPATTTALQVQAAGHFATIEAIRPSADSLHIVLVQRAVQSTDAPEATLFAHAREASEAASHSLVGTPTLIVPTRQ